MIHNSTRIVIIVTILALGTGIVIGTSMNAEAQTSLPSIPKWVKNTAKLWSEGQISDGDYLKSIQWLVDQKIIVLGQPTQSSIPVTSDNQSSTIQYNQATSSNYITDSNFYLVSANPDNYKYQWAQLSGKISRIETNNNVVAMLLDLDKPLQVNLQNIIWVALQNSTIPNQEGDCIYVEGAIQGSVTGQNLFGGTVSNVWMKGDKIQTISCLDAFYPALATITVNQVQTIGNARVTLEKIEFANDHTRVKIKVENLSQDKNINFYSFNSALIQGQTQLNTKSVFITPSNQIDSQILPGVVEEGYAYFDPTPPGGLKVILDITSDLFSDQKFVFNVS